MPSELAERIITLLRERPGEDAREIARALGVEKSTVNRLLYGELMAVVSKDNNHRWRLRTPAARVTPPPVRTTPAPARATSSGEHGAVEPTPTQQRLIQFAPVPALLINGQAGSGKTTVLAARAGHIQRQHGLGSMLFLTYNTALSAYVKRMLHASSATGAVEVKTFHHWASDFAQKHSYPFEGWFSERTSKLKAILDDLPPAVRRHRLIDRDRALKEFWEPEVEWIYGQGIVNLEQYKNAQRTGRGTAIRVFDDDKELVWGVFRQYHKGLKSEQRWDYNNPAGLVRAAIKSNGGGFFSSQQFDHVFIDEVQDFDRSWLIAVAPIPKKTLTMAGDLAQRIYKRSFTWKGAGITLPPAHSKKLHGSHRSTRDIMNVASYLADKSGGSGGVEAVQTELPSRRGPKVRRIMRNNGRLANAEALDSVRVLHRREPNASIIIAVQFNSQLQKTIRALDELGVVAEVAKKAELAHFRRGVAVTTYHQLKGLEFDHLILIDLHDKTMPGWWLEKVPEDDRQDEEKYLRRLVYVALTRAKKSVLIAGGSPFCRFFNDVPQEFFEER